MFQDRSFSVFRFKKPVPSIPKDNTSLTTFQQIIMIKRANNPDLPKHPTKNIFISKDYHLPSQNLYQKNLFRIIVKESNDIQTNPTDNLEIYRMTVIDYEHLVGSELFIFYYS